MLKIREFVNGTYVYDKVFMNVDTKEIIFSENRKEYTLNGEIRGFIKCLDYLNVDYDYDYNELELFPDDEMFAKCRFEDKSYGKYKSYGNYNPEK